MAEEKRSWQLEEARHRRFIRSLWNCFEQAVASPLHRPSSPKDYCGLSCIGGRRLQGCISWIGPHHSTAGPLASKLYSNHLRAISPRKHRRLPRYGERKDKRYALRLVTLTVADQVHPSAALRWKIFGPPASSASLMKAVPTL